MARTSSTPVAARTAEPRPKTGRRSTLSLLAISLRPEQWTKNLLVFAGVLFGGRLLESDAVLMANAAFAICAVRDLPVSLSGAPETGRRQTGGHAPDRLAPVDLRRPVDHHVRVAQVFAARKVDMPLVTDAPATDVTPARSRSFMRTEWGRLFRKY